MIKEKGFPVFKKCYNEEKLISIMHPEILIREKSQNKFHSEAFESKDYSTTYSSCFFLNNAKEDIIDLEFTLKNLNPEKKDYGIGQESEVVLKNFIHQERSKLVIPIGPPLKNESSIYYSMGKIHDEYLGIDSPEAKKEIEVNRSSISKHNGKAVNSGTLIANNTMEFSTIEQKKDNDISVIDSNYANNEEKNNSVKELKGANLKQRNISPEKPHLHISLKEENEEESLDNIDLITEKDKENKPANNGNNGEIIKLEENSPLDTGKFSYKQVIPKVKGALMNFEGGMGKETLIKKVRQNSTYIMPTQSSINNSDLLLNNDNNKFRNISYVKPHKAKKGKDKIQEIQIKTFKKEPNMPDNNNKPPIFRNALNKSSDSTTMDEADENILESISKRKELKKQEKIRNILRGGKIKFKQMPVFCEDEEYSIYRRTVNAVITIQKLVRGHLSRIKAKENTFLNNVLKRNFDNLERILIKNIKYTGLIAISDYEYILPTNQQEAQTDEIILEKIKADEYEVVVIPKEVPIVISDKFEMTVPRKIFARLKYLFDKEELKSNMTKEKMIKLKLRYWREVCVAMKKAENLIANSKHSQMKRFIDNMKSLAMKILEIKKRLKKIGLLLDKNDLRKYIRLWKLNSKPIPPMLVPDSLKESRFTLLKLIKVNKINKQESLLTFYGKEKPKPIPNSINSENVFSFKKPIKVFADGIVNTNVSVPNYTVCPVSSCISLKDCENCKDNDEIIETDPCVNAPIVKTVQIEVFKGELAEERNKNLKMRVKVQSKKDDGINIPNPLDLIDMKGKDLLDVKFPKKPKLERDSIIDSDASRKTYIPINKPKVFNYEPFEYEEKKETKKEPTNFIKSNDSLKQARNLLRKAIKKNEEMVLRDHHNQDMAKVVNYNSIK